MLKTVITKTIVIIGLITASLPVMANPQTRFDIEETYPELKGLKFEIGDGNIISIGEFLEMIYREGVPEQPIRIFGGEVPWPINEEKKPKKQAPKK